jgi:hypothetical protein
MQAPNTERLLENRWKLTQDSPEGHDGCADAPLETSAALHGGRQIPSLPRPTGTHSRPVAQVPAVSNGRTSVWHAPNLAIGPGLRQYATGTDCASEVTNTHEHVPVGAASVGVPLKSS